MASPEGANPLRPYYIPPSIGIQQDIPRSGTTHGLGPKNGSAASYASSARDMFSEMDYSDYLSNDSPSSLESIQEALNDWFYKYTSVLLGQPFDVAKTILQVRSQEVEDEQNKTRAGSMQSQSSKSRETMYSDVRMIGICRELVLTHSIVPFG